MMMDTGVSVQAAAEVVLTNNLTKYVSANGTIMTIESDRFYFYREGKLWRTEQYLLLS